MWPDAVLFQKGHFQESFRIVLFIMFYAQAIYKVLDFSKEQYVLRKTLGKAIFVYFAISNNRVIHIICSLYLVICIPQFHYL